MKNVRIITIEELQESVVVVYTQEEVELLQKIGVMAVVTYVNGGIMISPKGTGSCSLDKLKALINEHERNSSIGLVCNT